MGRQIEKIKEKEKTSKGFICLSCGKPIWDNDITFNSDGSVTSHCPKCGYVKGKY